MPFTRPLKCLFKVDTWNANYFGNFSLGVGTSREQFNCLHHLFLGPLLNLFILMSTAGVPFDLVLFVPLYSLVLTFFLAMFNLGNHTIKEKTCVTVVLTWQTRSGSGVSRLLSRSVFQLNTALLDTFCTQKWK